MEKENSKLQAALLERDLERLSRLRLMDDDFFSEALNGEYSCAMKSHFRKFGNQMSGSGNHLCEFTRVVFYLSHTPPAWTCHAQHQYL